MTYIQFFQDIPPHVHAKVVRAGGQRQPRLAADTRTINRLAMWFNTYENNSRVPSRFASLHTQINYYNILSPLSFLLCVFYFIYFFPPNSPSPPPTPYKCIFIVAFIRRSYMSEVWRHKPVPIELRQKPARKQRTT